MATSDWQVALRTCVERKDLVCARTVVDQALENNPTDLAARVWRARILAWTGQWPDAIGEYRKVLKKVPDDVEVLLGLTDVQLWSGDFEGALNSLTASEAAKAEISEVLRRRARAFVGLKQRDQALIAYRNLLRLRPNDLEARNGLRELKTTRHLVRVGTDADRFNFTDTAASESIVMVSHWNERWTTNVGATFYQRFDQRAEKVNFGVTYKLRTDDWATVSLAIGTHQDIASEREANLEYGHAFRLRIGPVRGVEFYIQQKNYWYSASRVTTVGTSQLLYLPKGCTWTIGITGADSAFGPQSDWTVSGFTRLTIPVTGRLTLSGLYGLGAENYSTIDQIGHFSAHSYGGGPRVQLNSKQDISGFITFQSRTQKRTQTTIGVSYGVRF